MKPLAKLMLILGLAAIEFTNKETTLSKEQVDLLQNGFKKLKLDLEFEHVEYDDDGYATFSEENLQELENSIPEDADLTALFGANPKLKKVIKEAVAEKAEKAETENTNMAEELLALRETMSAMELKHNLELESIKKDLVRKPLEEANDTKIKKTQMLMKKSLSSRDRNVVAGYLFGEKSDYLKVDSTRPWNIAASQMLEGNEAKEFMSTNVDFTQLNQDFGEFIAGRKGDIINWFMPNDRFNTIFPRITGVDEGDMFMSLDLTPITQAYQDAWSPKGDVIFTANKARLFDIKIDLSFIGLKAIERSWLNEFNTEGSYAYKMSFVEFILFSIAEKAVQEDQNAMINGVYVAPTAGKAGSHINKMNGLRELAFRLIDNKIAKPLSIGEWVPGSTVAFVRRMIEGVPEEFRSRPGLGFYASNEFVEKYWEDRRAAEGQIRDYDSNKTTIPGFDNIRLIAVPYAGNSKRVFITPVGNIRQLFGYKDNEYPKFEIEKSLRTVNVFTDYKKAMHIVVAGLKSETDQEFAERDYTKQLIWFNNADFSSDVPILAVTDMTVLNVSRHKYIKTIANTVATAIVDITGAQAGDMIKIECGSLENASTIANGGKFALTENFAPTEIGEFILLLKRSDGKFVELQRSAPSYEPDPLVLTKDSATPDVATAPEKDNVFFLITANDNTADTTLTNLVNAVEGATYKIYGNDGAKFTKITNGGKFVVSADWVGDDANYIELTVFGGKFYEISRQPE